MRGLGPASGLEFREVRQGPVELGLEVSDPEQTSDPAKQLDLVDRLGEEVVSPGLHPSLEVGGLVQRCDHQNQQVLRGWLRPKFPADLEPGKPRHHHVEQQEVGRIFCDDLQGLLAVVGRSNLAVEITQVGLQQLDILRVVIGDEDFWGS